MAQFHGYRLLSYIAMRGKKAILFNHLLRVKYERRRTQAVGSPSDYGAKAMLFQTRRRKEISDEGKDADADAMLGGE